MAKNRILWLCMAFAASVTLSMAQGTQVRSSSAKAAPDPLQNVTKPLTPKSAMPPQRKPAPVVPTSPGTGKTNSELIRLERQPVKAETPKNGGAKAAQGAPLVKSADASSGTGPAINFKYQKPVGGMQAATPNAKTANPSTPRVKKN
jgi:hypothetical protein